MLLATYLSYLYSVYNFIELSKILFILRMFCFVEVENVR